MINNLLTDESSVDITDDSCIRSIAYSLSLHVYTCGILREQRTHTESQAYINSAFDFSKHEYILV